jgi:hypothetical protein
LLFLEERPTVEEILTVVHGIKVTTARSLKRSMKVNQEQFEQTFWSPEVMSVSNPSPFDDDFKESIKFYKEKMKIN